MRIRRSIAATILAGAFVVAAGASASATRGEAKLPTAKKVPTVKVRLIEFQVQPRLEFIAKGKIKLAVKNGGTEEHELLVVRGDDPAALPTKADGSVDESQIPKADELGEIEGIKKGKTKSKTFKFSSGSYILLCNTVDTEEDGTIVSHFARGMFTTIQAG